MRKILLLGTAGLLLVAAKDGKEAHPPRLLTGSDIDPTLVLPPPAAPGSRMAIQELAALEAIDHARRPEEADQAKALGSIKTVTLFAGAMGPGFDLDRLPMTRALFDTVRAEEKMAVDHAKSYFQRRRPYTVDGALHPCSVNEDPLSSYPSGHTTMAYAMATILSRLVPSRAQAILARASEYQNSRLVCEQHYPSDVAAGQAYGTIIAERLMAKPVFRASFDAALQELRTAGIR